MNELEKFLTDTYDITNLLVIIERKDEAEIIREYLAQIKSRLN